MNEYTKVKNGDKELIETNSLLTFDSEQLEIRFSYRDESLVFLVNFIDDKKFVEHKIEFEILDESTLVINLINHNNTLGTFNVDPIELGTIGNRVFYFNYLDSLIHGTKRRKFEYSIFVGKEVQNG